MIYDFEQVIRDAWEQMGRAQTGTDEHGRALTEGERERMEMRRVGNLCWVVKERGWTARLVTNVMGYCVQFRGPEGEMVCGMGWERTAERALWVACGRLEERLKAKG